MPKKKKNSPAYEPSDIVDPQAWINLRSYGELKEWLRQAIHHRVFLPVVIPNNVMPVSYLTQLLIQSAAWTKTYLRTIVPELIKEWGASDNRESLDDLLILCGNLNCNEAEIAISRIVTEKLAEPGDTKLRLRGLSVLQEIGTDKSLHVFKRYIGDFDYAALCYRSLYRLNLKYAVTELENLTKLYESHDAEDELEDVFKILFKYTLKPPEYICVLQPLVDETLPEIFVPTLERLRSMNILNDAFFTQLPSISRAEFVKQILKRSREEDCDTISKLLDIVGVTLDPPTDLYPVTPEPQLPPPPRFPEVVPISRGAYFMLNFRDKAGYSESVPLITSTELGDYKSWAFSRNYMPDQNSIMSMLDGPAN